MKNVIVVNREMISDIIAVFEDWLEEKGITKEMLPNIERNDKYNVALIFGSDHDDLESEIRVVLQDNGIVAPEIFLDFNTDNIQNALNEALL